MEKSEKFKRTFEKFEKALNKFREIIESQHLFDFLNEELIIEVATKRFEYTFESMWKVLKEYLRREGLDCPTPLKCFKGAFKAGIISEDDEPILLEMVEKRNLIVHIYDSKAAKAIYEFIKDEELISAIKNVYDKLKARSETKQKEGTTTN